MAYNGVVVRMWYSIMATSRRKRIVPIVIIIIGCLPFLLAKEGWLNADQSWYLREGLSLSKGLGYSYLLRPPLFSMIFALLFYLLGPSVALAHLVVKLFHVGIVFTVYMLGKKMFDAATGWLSVLFVLGSTFFLTFATYLMPDGVQAFFMLLGLLFMIYAMEDSSSRVKYWILSALAISASFYIKQTGISWAVIPGIAFFLVPAYRKRAYLRNMIFFGLTIFVLLAIWWGYVYAKTGDVYLLSKMDIRPPQPIDASAREAGSASGLNSLTPIVVNLVEKSWFYVSVQIRGSFELFPLFVPAWLYALIKAARGSRPDRVMLVAFVIYFFPLLFYLGPRGGIDSVRNFYPVVLLSLCLSARLCISAWMFVDRLLGKWPGDHRWKPLVMNAVLLTGLIVPSVFTMRQELSFIKAQVQLDPSIPSWDGSWYNRLVRQSADWMVDHIPEDSRIMSSWVWSAQLDFWTNARYRFYQMPVKKVTVSAAESEALFKQDGLWGFLDNTLRERPSDQDNLLYLEKRKSTSYYFALWEYDFLEDIIHNQVEYLVFTGDTFLHPLTLLKYFNKNPGFVEIYAASEQIDGASYEIHVFKIHAEALEYQGFPLTISPFTLNQFLTDPMLDARIGSISCFERIALIGPKGFLARPVRYRKGYIDTEQDILISQNLIERCALEEVSQHPDALEPNLMLGWLYLDQNKLRQAIEFLAVVDSENSSGANLIYQNVARLHLLLGEMVQAEYEFQKLTQTDPNNPYAWIIMGFTHELNNKREQAYQAYRKAEEIQPDNPVVQAWLALYYEREDEYEQAYIHWRNVIFLNEYIDFQEYNIAKRRVMYQILTDLVTRPRGKMTGSSGDISNETSSFSVIDNSWCHVLYMPPPKQNSFQVFIPRNATHLQFSLALASEVWQFSKGNGVQFDIYIDDGHTEQHPFSEYIDPKNVPADRRWQDRKIDLSPWTGQAITITFATDFGPNGDDRYDWAGWGEPCIALPGGYYSLLELSRPVTKLESIEWDKAACGYKETPKLNLGDILVHLSLARIYQVQGKMEQAIAEYEKVIAASPDEVWLRLHLAEIYDAQGETEKALAQYQQTIELEPDNTEAYSRLRELYKKSAELYSTESGSDEAIALLREVSSRNPEAIWPHLELGHLYREEGKLEEAIAEYRKVIELEPDNADGYAYLSDAYKADGRMEEAVGVYERAMAAHPDRAWPHLGLGQLYQEEERVEEAIAEYRKAIELEPGAVQAYSGLSRLYRATGRVEEAVGVYEEAVAAYPDRVWPHLRLGQFYQEEGRLEEATAEYEEAIALGPDIAGAYTYLSQAYQADGRVEEAVGVYEEAVAANPDRAWPHLELGQLYQEEEKLEEALAQYQKAIELEPDSADGYAYLSQAYQADGRMEEAIGVYEDAVAAHPEWAWPHLGLGQLYQEEGRLEEALAQYQKAIALEPDNADGYAYLSEAYQAEGRMEEAVRVYEEAVAAHPDRAWPHLGLGQLYQEEEKLEEALAEYREAIELEPDNAEAYRHLRELYRKGVELYSMKGELDEAIALLREVSSRNPEAIWPHLELGHLYREEGKLDQAIAEYQKVIELEPASAEAYIQLGDLYKAQGRTGEAIALYQAAAERDPRAAWPHIELGKVYLEEYIVSDER
jgi:tetratricopeptide (TPR) repeat protein